MKLQLVKSIRTNNFNDEKVMEKIKGMWGEALSELKEYKGKVYGVYYDYESNYKGNYSLGVAITDSEANLNNPSAVIELLNNQHYKVFEVDKDDEQGIVKTWSKIWELEEAGSLKRLYTYDFEKYYPNGEIEIHIAVVEE